jgi:hypothetical protein
MRSTAIIVLGLVLLSGAAWLFLDRQAAEDAVAPAQTTELPLEETPAIAETEAPDPVEPAAPTAGDISEAPSDPSTWEVVEYGDFVTVREYRRNCKAVRHFLGSGDGEEVTTCERKFEIDHPYALFTNAQLAQIASTDGEAAYILAQRQLFPAEPGGTRDIESGVNNVLGAMIRGAEGQALDLLLDESVFSPQAQVERMLMFRDRTALTDFAEIQQKAAEISGLIRDQRLIVLGTEF